MLLLSIGGQRVTRERPPNELLVNQAGQEVQITVAESDGSSPRTVCVKAIDDEAPVRYRDWVEQNRQYVHDRSAGQVGYVHVPDMGPNGYAEFHRYFLMELDQKGLIVDVRFNSGGHVSALLLEKLARQRLGYDLARWMSYSPYPEESLRGPIVALTNEQAGSDGDIFSHSFKLMKLGKLIGRRTWGGVIGIWPRNWLVDGTLTTQPEFSFWFKDVGWGVENYGTDPDIEVDITPQEYVQGVDTQLDRAIEEVLKEIEENPPLEPDFENRPRRTLPA
jgi:tricorn protease